MLILEIWWYLEKGDWEISGVHYIIIFLADSNGYSYNTAWSSALNAYGNRVLSAQATIVTAHGKTECSNGNYFHID